MRPISLLSAALLGIGLLTYLCGNHHGPHFAADIGSRTRTALEKAGIPKIQVAADGQEVTIEGEVPTDAILVRAGETAANTWGVAKVNNLLTVAAAAPPAPKPPEMSATQRVAAVNCQKGFNAMLGAEKIQFATGRADIQRSSHRLLNRLADAASKCPAASIVVEGHTDSRGARDMNMKLSRSRAEAVVRYLEGRGVAASRLSAEGFGPDKPVAGNKTAAGMEKNRRTQFKVRGL